MIDTIQDNRFVSEALDSVIDILKEKYSTSLKETIQYLESVRYEIACNNPSEMR